MSDDTDVGCCSFGHCDLRRIRMNGSTTCFGGICVDWGCVVGIVERAGILLRCCSSVHTDFAAVGRVDCRWVGYWCCCCCCCCCCSFLLYVLHGLHGVLFRSRCFVYCCSHIHCCCFVDTVVEVGCSIVVGVVHTAFVVSIVGPVECRYCVELWERDPSMHLRNGFGVVGVGLLGWQLRFPMLSFCFGWHGCFG